MSTVLLTSHPKSGRKLFRTLWHANIKGWKMIRADRNHISAEEHVSAGNVVLLVRDGRDVLTTAYWTNLALNNISMTFDQYLDYNYREVLGSNMTIKMKLCPIEYWVRFNEKWLEKGGSLDRLIIVKFEDILQDQEKVIKYLMKRLPARGDKVIIDPSKGLWGIENSAFIKEKSNGIGRYKETFTRKNLKKFNEIAAPLMEKLKYYD